MYTNQHDPRFSQARTDSSYNTASPLAFPPPLPAGLHSNLSLGPSISSTPRGSSADPFQDAYPERESAATPNNNSAPLLPVSPDAGYKETAEASSFAAAGVGAGVYADDGLDSSTGMRNFGGYPYADVRRTDYALSSNLKRPFYKRPAFLYGMTALLAAIVVAVVVPLVLVHHHDSSSASASGGTGKAGQGSGSGGGSGNGNGAGGGKGSTNLATWGGNGSTVTTNDGSTFIYNNPFGGYCE